MKSCCLFPSSFSLPRALRSRLPVLLAGALWACASAWSQTVLDNAALLGMSRQQVMPALVNAQPVRSPRRLSSGGRVIVGVDDQVAPAVGGQQRGRQLVITKTAAALPAGDIDYFTQASLLYDLAGQMVAHLQSYLPQADEVRNVLDLDRQLIAKNIHAQMMGTFHESATEYAVEVRRGFTALKEPTYTVGAGQPVRDYRHTVGEPSRIKQMVFGYFSRCLYPEQKFDSDTERRFAVILERDADKWFKPAKGQFQLFYKLGVGAARVCARLRGGNRALSADG